VKYGVEHWWNNSDRRKPKFFPAPRCPNTKPTGTGSESNQGLRGEMPANNSLSDGVTGSIRRNLEMYF
jgi:hypothetical protein